MRVTLPACALLSGMGHFAITIVSKQAKVMDQKYSKKKFLGWLNKKRLSCAHRLLLYDCWWAARLSRDCSPHPGSRRTGTLRYCHTGAPSLPTVSEDYWRMDYAVHSNYCGAQLSLRIDDISAVLHFQSDIIWFAKLTSDRQKLYWIIQFLKWPLHFYRLNTTAE